LIKSTFLDNPFLEERIQREILRLKDTDENDWTIFGLGERGKRRELIFTNWDIVDTFPSGLETIYGLDFGSTDPNALCKIGIGQDEIWIKELVYKSEITNKDLIREMKMNEVSRSNMVYADLDPQRIKEIDQSGFKIRAFTKGSESVQNGIDWLKRYKIHITNDSPNYIKDFKAYCWKRDKKGDLVDGVPSHNFSHAPDSVRGAIFTHCGKKKFRVVQFT
jgi:phage terminase large subunit